MSTTQNFSMSALQILKRSVNGLKHPLRTLFIILALPTLLYCCSKGNKQGTEQKVDPGAPDKIKQLVPKYVKDCGPCGASIYQYEWGGQTVYTESCNGPACDCKTIFYDKNGDSIKLDSASFRAFNAEGKFVKNIWTCK